jgi:hypothetical protein
MTETQVPKKSWIIEGTTRNQKHCGTPVYSSGGRFLLVPLRSDQRA